MNKNNLIVVVFTVVFLIIMLAFVSTIRANYIAMKKEEIAINRMNIIEEEGQYVSEEDRRPIFEEFYDDGDSVNASKLKVGAMSEAFRTFIKLGANVDVSAAQIPNMVTIKPTRLDSGLSPCQPTPPATDDKCALFRDPAKVSDWIDTIAVLPDNSMRFRNYDGFCSTPQTLNNTAYSDGEIRIAGAIYKLIKHCFRVDSCTGTTVTGSSAAIIMGLLPLYVRCGGEFARVTNVGNASVDDAGVCTGAWNIEPAITRGGRSNIIIYYLEYIRHVDNAPANNPYVTKISKTNNQNGKVCKVNGRTFEYGAYNTIKLSTENTSSGQQYNCILLPSIVGLAYGMNLVGYRSEKQINLKNVNLDDSSQRSFCFSKFT